MSEWFADWFGETYLKLYPHRDEQDARRALTLIARNVDLEGARVLDLACGEGRHTVQFNDLGARTIGIDLSATLVRRARSKTPNPPMVVRGDMRVLPFGEQSFDIVVNLFTSFGYFSSDLEHQDVLKQVSALLVPNGWFILDFLNANEVKSGLVEQEEQEIEGAVVEIQRALVQDGAYVEKRIHVVGKDSDHLERVRLFTPEDLRDMLRLAEMHVVKEFGDYEGASLTDRSPRTILFARKM